MPDITEDLQRLEQEQLAHLSPSHSEEVTYRAEQMHNRGNERSIVANSVARQNAGLKRLQKQLILLVSKAKGVFERPRVFGRANWFAARRRYPEKLGRESDAVSWSGRESRDPRLNVPLQSPPNALVYEDEQACSKVSDQWKTNT